MFELDFSDMENPPGKLGPSCEDVIFLKKTESSVQYIDGHYTLPLPFRDSYITMPNNRSQAVKRANWQKKRMLRDETYRNDYVTFMNNLLINGYAKKIPMDQLNTDTGKVWYIPHHAVYHPMKPNKIRVVFDCSATYDGTSLNNCLLQGPDLTNSLIGVLTRFRQYPIAITGDIEAMFHQVRVAEEHHNFLRFLWWPNGALNEDLQEYCMAVHLFGAASSPSVANFALRKAADQAEVSFGSFVAETIRRNFYVDDCLKSVRSEVEAV
jgi:hypothetical protein